MSAHTEQRLETPDGTVVAYLAPTMEVSPTFDNSLNSNPIPDSQKTIVRDLRLFEHEIVFQGTFSHSDDLPPAHQNDLQTLFGSLPVTARDQVNRIIRFAYEQGGPFYLYDGSDEYTAESASNIDVANGVFPTVQVGQIRASREETFIREGFTLQFSIGLEDPL
jgi:hypothetical protein